MSGPITVAFTLDFGVILLAQHAIQEARSMKREYGEVLAQLRRREADLASTQQAQQAARLERIAATRREADRRITRLERLRVLAGDVPELAGRVPESTLPAPREDDDAAWTDYLRSLEAAARSVEALIASTGRAVPSQVLQGLLAGLPAQSIDDVLSEYVRQRLERAGLDAAQAEQFRETAARVLGRLDHPAGQPLPAALETLARAIVLAPSVERAEALASELRLAVQHIRDAQAAQKAESESARRLLAELPADAPQSLVHELERVAAGVASLDPALRKSTQNALDTAAADRADQEQAAAADVLEQSLRDLGYEVEDIEATLFADGGILHFTRPGWENYFIRMRLDPRGRSANFNVVRASGDEDTAERRRLDILAEDRWCTEVPRLIETLAARGMTMEVTRRLEAGEIPVQIVNAENLPRKHVTQSANPRTPPLARRTP